MIIYLVFKTQITLLNVEKISKNIALLNVGKISKNILAKYSDFVDMFLKNLAIKLFKCFDINKYIINLEKDN